MILLGFSVFFGGDKRVRTADLLNAIQGKSPRASKGFSILRGNGEEIEIPVLIPKQKGDLLNGQGKLPRFSKNTQAK